MFKKGDRVIHKSRALPRPQTGVKDGKPVQLPALPPLEGTVDVVFSHTDLARFPSGTCVNTVWDEPVQDEKAGSGRALSHDSEELVLA